MRVTSYLLLSICAGVWCKPITWTVHERRDSAPIGFVKSGSAPDDHIIDMRIHLVQGDSAGLEKALEAASTPSSPHFRQWLSAEQVGAFVKPSEATISAVTNWLSGQDLDFKFSTSAKDWITTQVPVGKANSMFNAQFDTYTHIESGREYVRTLEYSLPPTVRGAIKSMHPTTSFSRPLRGSSVLAISTSGSVATPGALTTDARSRCNSSITPACLQDLYNIPTTPATQKSNKIGVPGFLKQYAVKSDLSQFLESFRPDIPSNTPFDVRFLDGGENPQDVISAGEANLDIQYTVGVATGVPVTFISVGNDYQDGGDEGFLDVITALLAHPAPPQVLTTSYGFDTEADLSLQLTESLCNAYLQLTSRGVSIMFATGDGGVASTPGVQCDDGPFPPTFPTCPYVTMVGSTMNVPETGADLTAGGFSNYFAAPSYQKRAVEGYLKVLGNKHHGKFNRSGRAYPDLSTQGVRVQIVNNGTVLSVNGTSCSSPIFASIVALINDRLIEADKGVLGFLNPWIYANPWAFNDITTGHNPGCGTEGFSAAKGWDPVTGLGTPNFKALLVAAGL